ncbi:hypothetical protein CSV77_09460 [Sporosarcina sp. P16b]|uniref:ROK family protein n=1 Tax=Sporosarcina sp. P16b TaxID=2048261 RepID=UPI000C1658F5|nr:ROK family protein [Sporosarcina sp. P16b]PIC70294.1 hypothetical protein CSV77_09460 [Sporosarcina sp. P16b]
MIKELYRKNSIKDKRLKHLVALIYEYGPLSKSDLMEKAELTTTTCSRLLDDLLTEKIVTESGYGESSGGRKPFLFEINTNFYYLIGIDISRSYTKVLLMDIKLNVLNEARLKMGVLSTPNATVDFIEQNIEQMLTNENISKDRILGIGVGTIGPLDSKSGIILNPNQFPSSGWKDIPIKDILEERLGLEVLVDYGVNTALLAEYNNHYKDQYSNIIYMLKGVGSRTGMIIEGKLKPGTDKLGIHGQGHMIVDIHGRKCYCGSYGCVQAYSSIQAINTDIINALKQGKKSILTEMTDDIETIDFDDICYAVRNNDPLSCDIVENSAYYTGIGISNLINVLHPDLIIVNGATYNMKLFYDTVVKVATERSNIIFPNHTLHFSRGYLGENATAIGAGRLLVTKYLSDL